MAGQGENRPPSVHSITIIPNPIVRQGMINAVVEAKDPDQDEVAFRFRWIVNGNPVPGAVASTLNAEGLKLGDRVTVEVVPSDGKRDGSAVRAAEVPVGNTAPVVLSVELEPKEPKAGERVNARVEGADVDGDVIQYRYKWWRNNQLVHDGEQSVLETSGFLRDDVIAVSVIPLDQSGAGKEARAQPVTIANHPPKFTSSAPAAVSQGHLDYMVTASDAEQDPLKFSLDSAPPGMTIDERTGRLHWTIPAQSKGLFKVKVMVKDDHEGWAFQEFDIAANTSAGS